jgi:hypothetical protein
MLGMRVRARLEVVAENDTHVDPPERVGLDLHDAEAEGARHVSGSGGVAPSGQDPRRVDQRIGIPKKHHVQFLPAENSGGGAGGTLAPGAVQHLNRDAAVRQGLGGSSRLRLRARPHEQAGRHDHKHYRRTGGDFAPVATRLFQKRRVRS